MAPKGVVFLAPGQRKEVVDGIKNNDLAVVTASDLEVDGAFGTPARIRVKMEFKEVPNDLVASIRQSGRFSRQMISLTGNQGPSLLFLIGYPNFKWVYDRQTGKREYMMMNGQHETGLSYNEMQSRLLSLFMMDVFPVWVPNWNELGETIANYYFLFQQKEHTSHLIRPAWKGTRQVMGWRKPGQGDLILHIWQGFDKVGYKTGKDIWKFFGNMRVASLAPQALYEKIPGIGKVTAKRITEQLDAEYTDYFYDNGDPKK